MGNDDSLASLIHEINGKCANLKNATALLHGEDSDEEFEILGLMNKQARALADAISAYEASRRSKRTK